MEDIQHEPRADLAAFLLIEKTKQKCYNVCYGFD